MRNALHKEPDVVIKEQMAAPSINLCISTYSLNPQNQMLEKALIQLMENIRHDRAVDVNKRQIFPKHALNKFNSCICTCLGEFGSPFINSVERFNYFVGVTRLEINLSVVTLIVQGRTDGTIASLQQWDHDLLQIIAHISSKNRETFPHRAVSTHKDDSMMSSALQGLYSNLHAMVEKVWHAAAMQSLIGDMIQFQCREIGQ